MLNTNMVSIILAALAGVCINYAVVNTSIWIAVLGQCFMYFSGGVLGYQIAGNWSRGPQSGK